MKSNIINDDNNDINIISKQMKCIIDHIIMKWQWYVIVVILIITMIENDNKRKW